jgi:uncharacterized iron-regulated membrane protein
MIRRWHRWLALATALPFLVIAVTGCLLQIKKWIPAIQPVSQKSPSGVLSVPIAWPALLESIKGVPEAKVSAWKDIQVLDVRPALGVARARSKTGYEVQVDLATGAVLSAAPRYSSWLIEIHEGAVFGDLVRNGVFVPTAFAILALSLSGIWLLYRHYRKPRRKYDPASEPSLA